MITLSADQKTNLAYQLPDASSFILNDGSSISFDAKSYEDSRTLTLIGEAFFDVEKGSKFMVKTDKGDVTVLGTTFNVRSWDDIIKVECYSGSVRVESQGQNVTLQAGEGTETKSDGSWGKVTLIRQGPDWQNNTSDFSSTDVTKVFEEMERQFAVSIRYDGPVQRFSGAFTHTDIEAALQQVSLPLSLTFSKEGEDMYLVK